MLQREQLIKKNVFKDIDDTLIEKNYMVYLDDIKTKIETSLVITKKYNYKIIQNNT